jgi:hypothetical protein
LAILGLAVAFGAALVGPYLTPYDPQWIDLG